MIAVLVWVGLTWVGLSVNWPMSSLVRIIVVPLVCALLVTPFVVLANVRFRKRARQVEAKVTGVVNRFNNATVSLAWEGGKGSIQAMPNTHKEGDTVTVWVLGNHASEKLPGGLENFRVLILCGILMALGALGYLARMRG